MDSLQDGSPNFLSGTSGHVWPSSWIIATSLYFQTLNRKCKLQGQTLIIMINNQTDFNLATGSPLITSELAEGLSITATLSLMPGGNTGLISISFPSCPQKCELSLSDVRRPTTQSRETHIKGTTGRNWEPTCRICTELFDLLFPLCSPHISLHHSANKGRTASAEVALFSPLPFMFASIFHHLHHDRKGQGETRLFMGHIIKGSLF